MDGFNFDWDYIKSGSPYVTISSLAIAFNELAVKQLNKPNFIMLGFDENKLTIGVMGSKLPSSEHKSYEFASRINKDGWIRIGCKEFVQRLASLTHQDFSKAQRFETKLIQENLLIIEIPKK